MREDSERDVWAADVFPLAFGERVRVREDSERDVWAADVFTLALWERVRVREGSDRNGVPYGCSFGHDYKKGRFGTDPYDIFLNHGMSGSPSYTKYSTRSARTPTFFPSPFGRGSE